MLDFILHMTQTNFIIAFFLGGGGGGAENAKIVSYMRDVNTAVII